MQKPNEDQQKAINHFKGPAIVIAGPGTGKTFVIQERVVNLIKNHRVKPGNILVTTFTDKAADELKARILYELQKLKDIKHEEEITISTIHSLCANILADYGEYHNYGSNFNVLDDEEQVIFIKQHFYELGLRKIKDGGYKYIVSETKLKSLVEYLNTCSENNIDPDKLIEKARKQFGENDISYMVAEVYKKYINLLKSTKNIDFANLQRETLNLIRKNKQVAKELREKFQFIIVDEFQDINPIQADIVYELAKPKFNVFVVGDEDQSIYGFRGADIAQFRNFKRIYKAKEYKLRINYRSTKNIVTGTEEFIKPFRKIKGKEIVPKRGEKEPPKAILFDNENSEEFGIVDIIEQLKKNGVVSSYSDIAILLRTNYYGNLIEKLKSKNIKYKIGRERLIDNKYFKEIIRLLRYVSPEDSTKIKLYIKKYEKKNKSKKEKEIAKLIKELWWDEGIVELSFLNLSPKSKNALIKNIKPNEDLHEFSKKELIKRGGLSEGDADKISKLNKVTREVIEKKIPLLNRLYGILDATGILNKIVKEIEDKGEVKKYREMAYVISEVTKILQKAQKHNPKINLSEFYWMVHTVGAVVGLYMEMEKKEEGVRIMTIYQSKGLEFKVVIIPKIPEIKKNKNNTKLKFPEGVIKQTYDQDEEYRVYYVGMTRAKDFLILTSIKTRENKSIMRNLNWKLFEKYYGKRVKDVINKITQYHEGSTRKKKNENPKIEKFSYTKLKTYLDCPLRYNLIYIQEFKTPTIKEQIEGIIYHEILYLLNKEFYTKGKISERKIEEVVEKVINRFKNEKVEKDKILKDVTKYYNEFLKKRVKRILKFEKRFGVELGWNIIEGRYDLLYEDRKLGVTLVDFKAREKKGLERIGIKYQFATYYLALKDEYPNLNFAAYTIKDGKFTEYKNEKIRKLQFENIIKNKIIKGIKKREFKHKENDFCRHCPFRNACGVKINEKEKV